MKTPKNQMPTMKDFFKSGGILQKHFSHYVFRKEQQAFAQSVNTAILRKKMAVLEAGTGTGKTLGYLVPSILAAIEKGEKIAIVTFTKVLQGQLCEKELPFLQALTKKQFQKEFQFSTLKGCENYLCEYRLQCESDYDEKDDESRKKIEETCQRPQFSGERSEFQGIPDPFWQTIKVHLEICPKNKKCDYFETCYWIKAVQRAKEVDILVLNHYLYAYLCKNKNSLIQNFDVVIFDEAQHLPEETADVFALTFDLPRIVQRLERLEKNLPSLKTKKKTFEKAVKALEETISQEARKNERDVYWDDCIADQQDFPKETLFETRLQEIKNMLGELLIFLDAAKAKSSSKTKKKKSQIESAFQFFKKEAQNLEKIIKSNGLDFVRFFSTGKKQLVLQDLEVQKIFQNKILKAVTKNQAVIFTSAALSTAKGDFSYFCRQLGLKNYSAQIFASPFDYASNALLFVPFMVNQPRDEDYDAEHSNDVMKIALPLIDANPGGNLILCTSNSAKDEITQGLEEVLPKDKHPVFKQGDGVLTDSEVLARFVAQMRGVLVATRACCEGVDIKGQKLTLVIIDKLPFPAPNIPRARAKEKKLGNNFFYQYMLPECIWILKQGVGRLIRSETDKGVVVICDKRVMTKKYGKKILGALPKMSQIFQGEPPQIAPLVQSGDGKKIDDAINQVMFFLGQVECPDE